VAVVAVVAAAVADAVVAAAAAAAGVDRLDPTAARNNMKTQTMLVFAAAVLVGISACTGHHHSRSYSYPSPPPNTVSYSGTPAVTVETPGVVVDAPPTGKPFPTPQAAMAEVDDLLGKHDKARVEEVFGVGATEVLWSGDDIEDREAAERVKKMIGEGVTFENRSDEEVIAVIGKEKWPMPIPLLKTPEGWRFDLEEGKDELLTRRIGGNELETIATMYEYVEAQKEYFAAGRDGNPPAYAQKVRSTPGKKDGLYWEGEPASPFGDLVAEAAKHGYTPREGDAAPVPFHGYYYKILTSQGPNAPGGQKSYLDAKGLMTKGFAAIAWPANYGNSGIMTFLVSHNGILFEKDLGEQTETLAPTITSYDPDRTWEPTGRKPLEEEAK
jgi:hypothetical protein